MCNAKDIILRDNLLSTYAFIADGNIHEQSVEHYVETLREAFAAGAFIAYGGDPMLADQVEKEFYNWLSETT